MDTCIGRSKDKVSCILTLTRWVQLVSFMSIWGSRRRDHEEFYLLGRDAITSCRSSPSPTFGGTGCFHLQGQTVSRESKQQPVVFSRCILLMRLVWSSNLKLDAMRSSEKALTFYQTVQGYTSNESTLHSLHLPVISVWAFPLLSNSKFDLMLLGWIGWEHSWQEVGFEVLLVVTVKSTAFLVV
jgi:hypothetical protein